MNKKPDIVSLKWVVGLMNAQADSAETALVAYGNDPGKKEALFGRKVSIAFQEFYKP